MKFFREEIVNRRNAAAQIMLGDRTYSMNKESHEDSVTYAFQEENGNMEMTVWVISYGIKLIHHCVHTNRSYLGTAKKGNVIEIHHCLQGRMECQLEHDYFYVTPGDLAIDIVKKETREFVFPLWHYQGITISINTDIAPKCFSCFFKDIDIEPEKMIKKLCGKQHCFVIRSKDYIEHLFSEMYHVPCKNKRAYYKIKLLELLLVLSGIEPGANKSYLPKTLSNSQVELAKSVASYIEEHGNCQITVQFLSEKFHVSATHLQNAFKGVFGVTVFSYIRMCKMNMAALQLAKTDKTVMEIANEYGYENASKFAAAFREIMKESPLEYRKNHRFAV